ncbi:pre-mRNA splicing factor [Cordyceps fumosorosea ARSEF 2679]|uniref:Pre-mRNA splicing factor n=1 Tax=Cordyceps fumosorosea (strain ARSEF 2679) TaxID=1081104 RepID=A0A162MZX3_CORFA|nr:pre-mRNA splicing factor [Cordyceps fumosorosea ARSEF 2679]OAA73249.1 pre-mRNA splicing factor [Cordyceps fumosorosea ARSEF 2679]
MAPRLADKILQVFNVRADAYDFLVDLLEHRAASPHDLKAIVDQRLVAREELQHHRVGRSQNSNSTSQAPPTAENKHDLAGFRWEATDRLIKRARSLAREAADVLVLGPHKVEGQKKGKITKAAKRKADTTESHYWCQIGVDADDVFAPSKRLRMEDEARRFISQLKLPVSGLQPSCVYPGEPNEAQPSSVHSDAGTSPYFATPTKAPQPVPQRPSPGTVSCIPFPPLSAESFGIIQEQVAHDPFWLLIVVTFLIKTKGLYAIPTFLRVRERFPVPCDIANPENAAEILSMIRHLGLGQNRLTWMQKYARHFMFSPPRPGVRHAVRRYDSGEVSHDAEGRSSVCAEDAAAYGWEIGHMTQGAYAIDSWRIFCRDVLLGKAKDWNGKGAQGEFQPEWMRVLPADKELRAFLRWMWMREGWEWDPATGDRAVLREEMYRAVEESRVEYDIYGGLQILDEK